MATNEAVAKSAIDYLDGMPPLLMMQVEARIAERLKEYRHWPEIAYCGITNLPRYLDERDFTDEERIELARWILRRMMDQRINAGRQFDSILDSSRRFFAEAMLASALEPPKEVAKG